MIFGVKLCIFVPVDDLCLFGLMFNAPVNSYGHVGTYFQRKSKWVEGTSVFAIKLLFSLILAFRL